jgi:hypothetical protein
MGGQEMSLFLFRQQAQIKTRLFTGLSIATILTVAFSAWRGGVTELAPAISHDDSVTVSGALNNLPLTFVENRGQMDSSVGYYLHGSSTSVYFTSKGLTIAVREPERNKRRPGSWLGTDAREGGATGYALRLNFVQSSPEVRPVGEEKTPAVISYFHGPKEQWQTGLGTYRSIRYEELWPGVDLTYHGSSDHLKYTFLVKPGASPDMISLAYQGASSLQVVQSGELKISTPHGAFYDQNPVAYQEIEGARVSVPVSYALNDDTHGYGFNVGSYDPAYPLVIDPAIVVYAGYIGGADYERGLGLAVDEGGHAYVTGYSCSGPDTFPAATGPSLTLAGDCDAFIAKVKVDGTGLIYAGYIGGAAEDFGDAVAIDSAGNAYVTGYTRSSESSFPVTVGPDLTYNDLTDNPDDPWDNQDAFVAKVSADGTTLLYAGYIGGEELDFGENIAVDASGNAYITGITGSAEDTFPVTVGPDLTFNGGDEAVNGLDTFVAKIKADGTGFEYCGYIGGAGDDAVLLINNLGVVVFISHGGIAVDDTGHAYVSGATDSDETTFPDGDGFGSLPGPDQTLGSEDGNPDAYIVKVKPDGSGLDYAGYIGGDRLDYAFGAAVDANGNAYVVGQTQSDETTFPVSGGPDLTFNGYYDSYIAKIKADGTGLVYAGYIGGRWYDVATHVVVDDDGYAYVSGSGDTTDDDDTPFPVVGGPALAFHDDPYTGLRIEDAMVCKVNPDPSDPVPENNFVFCGFIGGGNHDQGYDVGFDSVGAAYIVGDTFSGHSYQYSNIPFAVTKGPDLTYNGLEDAFIAKIDLDNDGDGLSNSEEVLVYGTDPDDGDSDDDMLSDDLELKVGTDPLDRDSDSDGIPDGQDVEWLQNVVGDFAQDVFSSRIKASERVCTHIYMDDCYDYYP